MTTARPQHRGRRRLRACLTALLPLVVATCLNDRPAGPGGSVRTVIRLTRVARGGLACGPSPVFTLAKARVLLRQSGRSDSTVAVANFAGDTATLSVDVPLAGETALFDINAQAIDSAGDTLFRARDTATARAGTPTTVGYLQLWYAAPDSALQTLAIAPRDTQVRYTGGYTMRAAGTVQGGGAFGGKIRAAYVTRDATIATVTPGGAVSVFSKPGATWVVAGTYTGLCDSTTVIAVPPVASIDVKPDTADIPRDGTIQLVVTLRDAGGNQLFGRPVTWGSTNANASVDTTGLVKGLIANKSARIFAAAEGKADSTGIGILPKPVGKVTVTPKTANVDVGSTLPLSATAYDSAAQPNADWPMLWSTLDATLATVSASGVVTGVKPGVVGIVATAGGVADTATITVKSTGPDSTVVAPRLDTLFSFNDSLQLTAKSYNGVSQVAGSYTWVSRDPTVVTVNASGLVVAKANGSTYVVVTEAGGTKDSAHVFMIQKVSSITVTPTPVQRYLGTVQQFSANALDARGNAVAGASFTWGQSDPSITNIDATGLATMIAIGTDTVKATVGTVVGKAVLTVKSAITSIVVTPAGVTLTALAQTQAYSAVAHDTLGAVMTGINFNWTSTNPGVATVPGTVGTTQTATAAANGITAITATAQGVSGAANLTVAQVLVSIVAGPNPTVIGQGGQAQLIARGKDANGFFIPGGNWTWASDAPTNVTVDVNGIVKGIATPPASAHITASSGAITSNQVLVNVDNSVPPRVSWGRDTLAIGRGSLNNSLPLYLSKPPVGTITVTVAVKDTFAYFSPTTVTFNPGVTTQNANLDGRNAGVTEVYATDGSGQYAPDTAVLLVQAAAKFPWGGVSINANDYYPTQILLTDPAPAGGIYLAFNYGTAGKAQVSPDPAFIPAGQLAANVNVNGLAAGSTTITPAAPGVSGTSSTANVYAPTIAFSSGATTVVGAGQYDGSSYAYVPTTMYHPLVVSLTSSDTTIANQAPSLTIPTGGNYTYFTTFGYAIGKVTQTAAAPLWTSAVRNVIVSTPKLSACCTNTINTTSAAQTLTAYTADSTGVTHYRINPLFVTLTSTDTSILTVVDTTITVGAGAYYAQGKYKPAGNGGVAYVRVTAGGHTSDSIRVTVNAPNLALNWSTSPTIGTDQQGANHGYISIPNAVGHAVTVSLASSDTSIAWVTPLFTIPAGQTYAYFDVRGHALGKVTLTATAAGYTLVTGTLTVGTPQLIACCSLNLPNFYPDVAITETTADSVGYSRAVISPVIISLSSTNAAVATVDSGTITMPSGTYSNSHAHVHIVGIGSAKIIATAPGYKPDTIPVTVYMPSLNSYAYPATVGARQRSLSTQYVNTPNSRPDSVEVMVANAHPAVMGAPDSVKIPKNNYLAYYDISGLTVGKDTLTFTAGGYNPVKQAFVVTPAQLHGSGLSNTYNTTSPPANVNVTATDTLIFAHNTMDTVTVHVVSTDTTVMKFDSAYLHIPKGSTSSAYASLRFVGPGTARLLYTDSAGVYKPDSSVAVTVVGPSLHLAYGTTISSPLTVGMRQHVGVGGNYVYVDNPVTGAPLTVNLLSTDPTVATVVATVTIPVGQTTGNFDIFGQDTIGTIQIKASATGYAPTVSYVQVGHPKFAVFSNGTAYTTSPPSTITVYAEDQAGNTRYASEDVHVTLTPSNGSVAAPDSATITIKKDAYYTQAAQMHYLAAGTTTLTASDPRGNFYKYDPYTTNTITVSVPTVSIGLSANVTLGMDQYIDASVSIPNTLASPLIVTLGHSSGATTTPATVTIPAGQVNASYRVTGAATGSDVLTSSATGFQSSSATIAVDSGVVVLSGWPASVKAGDSVAVTIYSYDAGGNLRYLGSPVTFTLAPNANIVFDQGGATVTTVTIPALNYGTGTFYVKGVTAGTGSVSITGGRFRSYTNTLTVNP